MKIHVQVCEIHVLFDRNSLANVRWYRIFHLSLMATGVDFPTKFELNLRNRSTNNVLLDKHFRRENFQTSSFNVKILIQGSHRLQMAFAFFCSTYQEKTEFSFWCTVSRYGQRHAMQFLYPYFLRSNRNTFDRSKTTSTIESLRRFSSKSYVCISFYSILFCSKQLILLKFIVSFRITSHCFETFKIRLFIVLHQ